MNIISNNPVEIADAAMKYELEGHKILIDAKDKATNPLAKATFQFLADQELTHIEVIKKFAASLADEGEFNADEIGVPITKREAGEGIKGIFAKFKAGFDAVGGKAEERTEVYNVALDMERHGHDFYEKAVDQSADETAKKFYNFLAGEEINHFEIIQDTRDFLKQPDAFMAMEERWMQI